jgi:hypothetical protein
LFFQGFMEVDVAKLYGDPCAAPGSDNATASSARSVVVTPAAEALLEASTEAGASFEEALLTSPKAMTSAERTARAVQAAWTPALEAAALLAAAARTPEALRTRMAEALAAEALVAVPAETTSAEAVAPIFEAMAANEVAAEPMSMLPTPLLPSLPLLGSGNGGGSDGGSGLDSSADGNGGFESDRFESGIVGPLPNNEPSAAAAAPSNPAERLLSEVWAWLQLVEQRRPPISKPPSFQTRAILAAAAAAAAAPFDGAGGYVPASDGSAVAAQESDRDEAPDANAGAEVGGEIERAPEEEEEEEEAPPSLWEKDPGALLVAALASGAKQWWQHQKARAEGLAHAQAPRPRVRQDGREGEERR